MSEKTEIIITIPKRRNNKHIIPGNSPKGIVESAKTDDYLARRTPSKGIRFWDLGLFFSGTEWLTVQDYFLPEPEPVDDNVLYNYSLTTDETNTLFANLYDEFFGLDLADWKRTFYKIKKGDIDYEKNISVYYTKDGEDVGGTLDTLDDWTGKGLKLSAGELSTLFISTSYYSFNSPFGFAFSAAHITNVFDFDASETEFTPSADMDVFLIPSVVGVPAGTTVYRNGEHTSGSAHDLIQYGDTLLAEVRVLPRELLADMNRIDYTSSYYRQNFALIEVIKQFEFVRAFRGVRDFLDAPPHEYVVTRSEISPGEFPVPEIYPAGADAPVDVSPNEYSESFGANFGFLEDGNLSRLKAVVKQGDDWFYVWQG